MEQTRFTYPAEEFDIGLCVLSGQAFRWKQIGDSWVGVVGDRLVRLQRFGEEVAYETYPQAGDFELIRSYFRLDQDLKALHQHILSCDPSLEGRLFRFQGLRVLRWNDPEECLFSFLCTPNNNIPRITGMISRMSERCGEPITALEGVSYKAFPKVEVIASAHEEDLRAMGFGYRARTQINAARAVLERGSGWMESLKSQPYEQAHAQLTQLPGVGPKIADCICLFGLDHLEAVPVDTHLWQAVGAWYIPELAGKALTDSRYRQVGDFFRSRFGSIAGWAHQYLFYAHLKGER